jgi:fluoride exporter
MTFSWQTLLAVGIGGFFGAVTRAYVVHLTNKHFSIDFPAGILLVNVIGSFLIGILFATFTHYAIADTIKSFLTTGFLGALTTYSTFAIESFLLLQTSIIVGLTNIFLNLFGTIAAAALGYRLIHFFVR